MTVGALHARLRAATRETHERLHRHPGLCAAASGRIDAEAYVRLLTRLYGFHRAFEARLDLYGRGVFAGEPVRSSLLASDLAALGVSAALQAAAPLCDTLAPIESDAQALGAIYVVEGSALGGAQIARALSEASSVSVACRFFSNDGAPARGWKELLARLGGIADPQEERVVLFGAVTTFRTFEDWMADWAPAQKPDFAPAPGTRAQS